MLFRQNRSGGGSMPSVLGPDVRVDGELITDGDLFIAGSVKGRVVAHKLTVGENASLAGIVEADTVIVAGSLSGKLTANIVTIKRTAIVSADITHVQLSIETGGSFEGYSRRVNSLETVVARGDKEKIGSSPMPALTHAEVPA
jgi:cytoskeletal protein CcmA (bactofilin family)